jgi:hypothetical protein
MRGSLRVLGALLALGAVAGCALVDTVDNRADFMNQSVTRFRNQTILRNIVRSSNDEPLSFAALSTVQGHNTSVNQFPTFPPFSWQSWTPQTAQGTNSQYNVSSDFTMSPVDDSGTYAALLSPLDLSTIAVFTQTYGLQSNFLYLLFFDQIKIADGSGRVLAHVHGNSLAYDKSHVCAGPFCGSKTMVAYTLLAYLNLQVNLEKGGLPGQARKPRTQLCFGRETPPPVRWGDLGLKPTGGRIALPARKGKAASFCDEEDTWLSGSGEGGGGRDSGGSVTCVNVNLPGADKKGGSVGCATRERGDTKAKPAAHYIVYDARNNLWIELSTRSTWGLYQFLGSLAYSQLHDKRPHVRLIQPGYPVEDELVVLNLTKDEGGGDCFAEVEDRGRYCVPNGPRSRLTRVSFSILHQLMALQRAAVNVPQGSSSVRVTQ